LANGSNEMWNELPTLFKCLAFPLHFLCSASSYAEGTHLGFCFKSPASQSDIAYLEIRVGLGLLLNGWSCVCHPSYFMLHPQNYRTELPIFKRYSLTLVWAGITAVILIYFNIWRNDNLSNNVSISSLIEETENIFNK
jgi:hypothetical protein